MNQYAIYCTEEQTTKAFELGANIIKVEEDFNAVPTCYVDKSDDLYETPTAEQMIGWLEEQRLAIDVVHDNGGFEWSVWVKKEHCSNYSFIEENDRYFSSRKEATLAAIDAALDYLNKKE